MLFCEHVWLSYVLNSYLLTYLLNLCRTRLVLRWVTVSGSIPNAGHLFQYVTNQPPKANSAFHPSGVGKWVPASTGKAKAGMVHSDSGWTRGVQVKLWDPLRTRAIPERLSRCIHDEALYTSTFTFTFTFTYLNYFLVWACTARGDLSEAVQQAGSHLTIYIFQSLQTAYSF